jgi:surface protein
VPDLQQMFYDANSFNGDLSSWEVSSITTMFGMFANASSFPKGLDKTALEYSASNTYLGWATNISGGPINESSQSVTFTLSKTNNSLFSVQPAISSSGTLTFTSADNASGLATVTISLSDDGGTANEGD